MPYKNKEDQRIYNREYQRQLRKVEREIIRDARERMGIDTRIRRKKK